MKKMISKQEAKEFRKTATGTNLGVYLNDNTQKIVVMDEKKWATNEWWMYDYSDLLTCSILWGEDILVKDRATIFALIGGLIAGFWGFITGMFFSGSHKRGISTYYSPSLMIFFNEYESIEITYAEGTIRRFSLMGLVASIGLKQAKGQVDRAIKIGGNGYVEEGEWCPTGR